MLVWGKHGPKPPFGVEIRLSQSFGNEYSSRRLGRGEGKSEIVAIPNKYKDTLDDLIDSSDTESPDQPESPNRLGPIDKGIHNAPRSKDASPSFSEEEEDCLDEDVLVTSLKLAHKTRDS